MNDEMDTANPNLSKLECSVCSKAFTDPKLLQCFHVFCKDCLELKNQDQHGQSLHCPKCHQSTLVPAGGVSGLQSAFHIHHLFEIQDILKKVKAGQEGQKIQCEKCKKGEATDFCHDCGKFICLHCKEIHENWEEFSSHKVTGLEQLSDAAEKVSPARKTLYCSIHPGKELDLFCETDQELICQHCFFKAHRDHQCDLLGEVFPKHQNAILTHVETLEQLLGSVNEAAEHLHKTQDELKHQREEFEAKIQEMIEQLREALQVRKKELVGQLDAIKEEKVEKLLTQGEKLELIQSRLKGCLDFVSDGLKTGSEGSVITMEKSVRQLVEQMRIECDEDKLSPQQQADMALADSGELLLACQQFGHVYRSQVFPQKCYATGEGLKTATVDKQSTVTLHAVDRANSKHAKPLPDGSVSCELVSCAEVGKQMSCSVRPTTANEYEISYQPIRRGEHLLHIKVSDQHIKGSPFTVVAEGDSGIPRGIIPELNGPRGVAINRQGQVIIAEKGGHCISIYNPHGEKVTSFGKRGSEQGQFIGPVSVAVDKAGNILVVDKGNQCIQRFAADGTFESSVGNSGKNNGEFSSPHGISLSPSGNVYVCDTYNHRIQIFSPSLTFKDSFGCSGSDNEEFRFPWDVAFDSYGNVYVADGENHRILVFTEDGRFLRKFGKNGAGEGELNWPASIAIDSNDVVYVAEKDNHRISLFTNEGCFLRSFGTKGDGPGQFDEPLGVAVNNNGVVYVSDWNNRRLQVF